MDGIFVIQDWF